MPKRMHIYVNDDLLERLKPFAHRINVSAVACKGLEAEIARLEAENHQLDTMSPDELRAYTRALLDSKGRTK